MALEFRAELPGDIPGSVPVFELAAFDPAASLRRLLALASSLGLPGLPHETKTSRDWVTHREGAWDLAIHNVSTALVARHGKTYGRDLGRDFDLDDERATSTALDFVRSSGLLPDGEIGPTDVTHLKTSGGETDGDPGPIRLLDAGVVVTRQVEGLPVSGPGGSAMLNIDPDGNLSGISSIWRALGGQVGDVATRGPEEVTAALERIAERVRGDVVVRKASFGYFEQGLLDPQRFLQPAYSVVYDVVDGDVVYRAAEVVAASEQTYEALLGPKRFPGLPQEARAKVPA